MNREHCAKTFDELWPGSDWTALIVREFWRRVERFNLTDEQVEAVLHEYRMTTRYKSPVPADLLNRLRVAAFPERKDKPRVSDGPPADFQGRIATYRDWCEYARTNGIKNHLGRIMGRTA